MRMSKFALFAFAIGSVVGSTSALAQYDQVGAWTIMGRSSEYKGCVARARYNDGTILRFGHDSISNQKFLNMSNSIWTGETLNSPQDITMDFGRYGRFSVEATFRQRDGMPTFEIGGLNDGFLDVFSAASSLAIIHKGMLLTRRPLNLAGTRRATRALQQCQFG